MKGKQHLSKLSRRGFLAAGTGMMAVGLDVALLSTDKVMAKPDIIAAAPPNADQALKQLMQGNQRYVSQRATHPDSSLQRIKTVATGQHPFAIILGCADSRVPPELLFDQGLGSLFVVRVAGNLVDDATLGSIEYAAAELKSPLLMVLGHERCGAVKATLDGGELPGHIGKLVEAIKPGIAAAKGKPGDALDNAVKANVQYVVKQLKASTPILTSLQQEGKLKIVGARYDLDEGRVTIVA